MSELPVVVDERLNRWVESTRQLMLEIFERGREDGAARVRETVRGALKSQLDQLEREFDALTPEMMSRLEEVFRDGEQSALASAYFGGISEGMQRLSSELVRVSVPTAPSDPTP